jgi:hypothetical protein
MKKPYLAIVFLFAALLPLHPQKNVNSFLVVSYNVENLFDTLNSPEFDDDEFTPSGSKQWTYERYEEKLDDLADVIRSLPGKELPALIGLAEVENQGVLEDLIAARRLRREKYQIIHEDGKDPRGIECALIYQPEVFSYHSHKYIPVEDLEDPDYIHRGILHVKGKDPTGQTFMCL